jgi:hypothetical protein
VDGVVVQDAGHGVDGLLELVLDEVGHESPVASDEWLVVRKAKTLV